MPQLRRNDEIWAITQDGARLVIVIVHVQDGKEVVRKYVSADHARVQHDKLVAEKLATGWGVTSEPAPGPGLDEPREPALEAAIAANPDDTSNYAVYGDWYQQQAHPRGELIALQLAQTGRNGANGAARNARKLGATVEAHLARYKDVLLGKLVRYTGPDRDPPFTWRAGFIHGLQLGRSAEDMTDDPYPLIDVISDVIAHPSGRFLAEVSLGPFGTSGRPLDDILAALVPAAPTLRALTIVARSSLRALGALAHFDRLRELTVKSYNDVPTQAAALAALAQVPPTLERLHVRLDAWGQAWAAFAPFFARTDLGALHHLALRCSFVDDALTLLATSPLAATLKELDIAMTEPGPGLRTLLANRERFTALRSVTVSADRMVPKLVSALREAVPTVRDVRLDRDDQRFEVDDDPRYDELDE